MFPLVYGLRTYTYLYGLSAVVQFVLVAVYCRRWGFPSSVALGLGAAYVLGMTFGAKFLYDLLHHQVQLDNYLSIGPLMAGGLWGGPLAYLAIAVPAVLLLGRDRARLLDLVALTLPLPMIVAKLACWANGCCYGAACDWPWTVAFRPGAEAPAGIARHPTQLYEIVVLLVIVFVFARLDHEQWRGRLIVWFIALYGLGRPLTEFFRDPALAGQRAHFGPLTDSQAACLAAAALAALMLLKWRDRTPICSATTTPDSRIPS